MKKLYQSLLRFILLALISSGLFANDGVDRYRKGYPNLLYYFPAPISDESGYRFLDGDLEGGADGDPEFRWAQQHAVALVRIAAFNTYKALGKSRFPMAVFDLSAENGDTPIQWTGKKAPSGRHPGSSHDGGINLDLGYYLTSLTGKKSELDFSACTNHYSQSLVDQKVMLKDEYICKGPADRLDTTRQAYFFITLFKINRQLFDGDLLEEIGIDQQIAKKILEQVRHWKQRGKYDINQNLISDMKRVFVFDEWEGWSHYHHHHSHVRLRNINLYGKHRAALEKLLKQEEKIDYLLLAKTNKAPVIFRLLSYGLSRSIEMRWPKLMVKTPRFRLGGQEKWQLGQNGRLVLDLPIVPHFKPEQIYIFANLRFPNNKSTDVRVSLFSPKQDPRLAIGINPEKITGSYKNVGNKWTFETKFPKIYRHYLTNVKYQIYLNGENTPQEFEVKKGALNLDYKLKPGRRIRLVKAKVYASKRKMFPLTLYLNAAS